MARYYLNNQYTDSELQAVAFYVFCADDQVDGSVFLDLDKDHIKSIVNAEETVVKLLELQLKFKVTL